MIVSSIAAFLLTFFALLPFMILPLGALCTVPKKSPFAKYKPQVYKPADGLEKIASQFGGVSVNYNVALFGAANEPAHNDRSNVELTMKLLLQQLKAAGPDAKNVFISPLTLARALVDSKSLGSLKLSPAATKQAQDTDYDAAIQALTKSGDVSLNITAASSAEAGEAFVASLAKQQAQRDALKETQLSHLVKLPFPLNQTAAELAAKEPIVSYTQSSTSSSSTPATPPPALTHALNFTGYLAPRFTSPETRFPNYFFNFRGEKKITHMMVKTSKMWYIEHEKFQMIDLPYLNPNFVATLVVPRTSGDRTIQDHPDEFAYDQTPRSASTVHELLSLFSTPSSTGVDLFSHHAKFMTPLPGLIGLPGFEADHAVTEKAVGANGPATHRAALALSPHGLDVGARTPRQRNGATANFTALCDHPFLFFIRSTLPDHPQILFAGVVNDVYERQDWSSKYPLPVEWSNYKEEVAAAIAKLYAPVA